MLPHYEKNQNFGFFLDFPITFLISLSNIFLINHGIPSDSCMLLFWPVWFTSQLHWRCKRNGQVKEEKYWCWPTGACNVNAYRSCSVNTPRVCASKYKRRQNEFLVWPRYYKLTIPRQIECFIIGSLRAIDSWSMSMNYLHSISSACVNKNKGNMVNK